MLSRSVPQQYNRTRKATRRNALRYITIPVFIVIVIAVSYLLFANVANRKQNNRISIGQTKSTDFQKHVIAPAAKNPCAGVTLDKEIIVSISARHLWACGGTQQQYASSVVTGMENLPADLTPVGVYHIYDKEQKLYLNGSDSTGSWHDYVYYWMPFLSNQYGIYGFHDATWRSPSDFGNIDPYSTNASHGCVELPLDTARWLYDWAAIGTTVSVEA